LCNYSSFCNRRINIVEQSPYPTQSPQERALLVNVHHNKNDWTADASLEELALLCETADLNVVGSATQNLHHPNPRTYVGSGKLDEIADLRISLQADVVVFDDELSPAQLRNIEKHLDTKVIDRPTVILDIFARRAFTHEGRLQVELAQLEYRLPRLTRMWSHLSRQAAGGVGLRGPGETQLEVDRRLARTRISHLKQQLSEVHRHRELYRERRRRNNVPVVALVGYTNAGKSTLLNQLSDASVLEEDKLFATLDPTTRRIRLPGGDPILLTDTVGFINNLPTSLIAAFRATLEEIEEATVLLHILDITHPNAPEQAETVRGILEELGVSDKPMITALNKIDMLDGKPDALGIESDLDLPSDYVPISARGGIGLDVLLERIEETVARSRSRVHLKVCIPYQRSELVNLFHRAGQVECEEFSEDGTHISGMVPARVSAQFEPFILSISTAGQHAAVKANDVH
jgi:GTPase